MTWNQAVLRVSIFEYNHSGPYGTRIYISLSPSSVIPLRKASADIREPFLFRHLKGHCNIAVYLLHPVLCAVRPNPFCGQANNQQTHQNNQRFWPTYLRRELCRAQTNLKKEVFAKFKSIHNLFFDILFKSINVNTLSINDIWECKPRYTWFS